MAIFSSGIRWLVVFLGNPGPEYEKTRHNLGFLTGDCLAEKKGVTVRRLRFRALTGSCELGGQKVLLMKPQTYMNLSGEAVGEAARFYKIPPERVLVVSDDIALPCGRIRVRAGGSAGGHNGLKNIIQHLGSDNFGRVRIGVGAPSAPGPDQIDWVLGTPSGEDAKLLQAATVRAAEAVEEYISRGAAAAMNKFNSN